MESARLPESQGTHATRGGHRAAHGGKAAASASDAAQQPQDAFSALLSLLGGGDDALDSTDALAFGDGSGAQAPAGLALLAQDAATGVAPGHAGHAAAAGQAADPAAAEAAAAAAAGLLGLLPGHQGAAVAQTQALGAGGPGTAEGLLAGASASKGGVGSMWGSWGVQGAEVQGSLVAQTAAQDGAAEAAQLQGLAQPGERAAPAKSTKGAGPHLAATAATATDTSVAAKSLDKKQAVDLPTAATVSATGAAAGAGQRDTGSAAAGAAGAAHRLADGDLAAQAALAAPGLQALAEALGEPRRAGRAESSQEGAQSVHGITATGESAADPAQAVPDGAGVTADASHMQSGGDDQLAQQVAFWVNQKTQNAELTLDQDGQPVQVHVSLSGNEAHVTFRSDQVQTVAALQLGAAQLRDALAQQGLVLAGVQVGSAGADGKGGGHPQGDSSGRQGARQGRALVGVQGIAGAVAQAARASGTAGASALDVFV